MILSSEQLRVIKALIAVIEVGVPVGGYDNVTLLKDGKKVNGAYTRQVTYGRFQTTEWSHLGELLTRYCAAPGAVYAAQLRPYISRIAKFELAGDKAFHQLLRDAGRKDPVMATVQEAFFADVYFAPAKRYAEAIGLTTALGALIVMDSFVHGGIEIVRGRFPEVPPANGGDEKKWLFAYTRARDLWLSGHANTALHATVYRTRCWLKQIARGNWDLSMLPIELQGEQVR